VAHAGARSDQRGRHVHAAMPGEPRADGVTDFEQLHRALRPGIHRYLAGLVGEDEAEDLTQEVFVKVSDSLGGFRGESSVSTWVYRIAKNVAIDRLRSVASSSHLATELSNKIAAEQAPPPVEQQHVRKEMNDCIRQFVANLPPDYRSVMILSELKGLSNRQIADALGLTLDTVKIRLHRARARLKADLAAGCSFYRDDRNELACEPKFEPVSFSPRPPSIGLNDGGGRRQ